MRDWKKWAKLALVRALRTAAQTAVASLSISYTLEEVQWGYTASTVALSALLSLLMSIAGLPEEEI